MDKWEIIARKMAILASWGYDMQFFEKYFDDMPSDFLTTEWLIKYYGKGGIDKATADEIDAIDLLASNA